MVRRPTALILLHGFGSSFDHNWRQTGWVDCPLYRRTELAVGQSLVGPVIVEEYGSTVVVPIMWRARIDIYRNLILDKKR